jgi:hypothetical protein
MHAYDHKGNPRHTVKTKQGAKNPTRATRASDAAKNNWLPSVSECLDVMDKDWLRRHTAIECVEKALKQPAIRDENISEYASRLVDKTMQESGEAAEIGTRIHDIIDNWALKRPLPNSIQLYGDDVVNASTLLDPVISMLKGFDIRRTEFVTVNSGLGYAGTVDMEAFNGNGVAGLIDFKTKKTKVGKKIKPSDSHVMQLAAYHASEYNPRLGPEEIDWKDQWAANIYISTTEPGRVELKMWNSSELALAFEGFCSCCGLWRYLNNYDARS